MVAHVLPDVLDWVELGAIGRKCDDASVCRHFPLVGQMPTRLIHQQQGVGSLARLHHA
jgi:hypothetical protein